MDKFINIITYTLGFLFFLQGALWVLSPVDAAAGLGMTLLTDKGLSTQIGDFTSFFFVVGIFTLIGAYTKESTWFYAPIALLGFAAIFRTLNVQRKPVPFYNDLPEITAARHLVLIPSRACDQCQTPGGVFQQLYNRLTRHTFCGICLAYILRCVTFPAHVVSFIVAP